MPVERDLVGGQSHRYQFALNAGQYLHVIVDQRGIDIIVTLRGPDGAQLIEIDGMTGPLGAEELVWEASSMGTYALEVRAKAAQARKGLYEVTLQQSVELGSQQRARIAAQQLYMEGRRAQQSGAEGMERAEKKYEEALMKWREARVPRWEGMTLTNLAIVCRTLSRNEKALDCSERALAIQREIKDRSGEVITLTNLGIVYRNLSQYDKARDCHERALAIRREIKDKGGEGVTLYNLGNIYSNLAQYEKSRDYYEQSLAIAREIKDRRGEGAALSGIGIVSFNLGQYEKSIEYYEQALALHRDIKDRGLEGVALTSLGNTYVNLSQFEKARDYYEQALAVQREIRDKLNEGASLNNLGIVYRNLGEYEKSRDYAEQALRLQREIKYRQGEGVALNSLGLVSSNLRQYEKAREYFVQALAIRREIKDRRGEAWTVTSLGSVYLNLGQYAKAREHYEQALDIQRDIKDKDGEGSTLAGLGDVNVSLKQFDKARDFYAKALAIRREIKDKWAEAQVLYRVARVDRDSGKLSDAHLHIESALSLVESIRANVGGQELRTSYFASVQDYYTLYIDVLMRLHKQRPAEGYAVAALLASERARARSLIELLTESRVEIRQGVDPALLDRERILRQQLNVTAERQTRLLSRTHTEQQVGEINKEIQTLTSEYQATQTQIRATSPRYAALTQPQPLTLVEIKQLLDSETVILEYSLGEDRSYLWTVTNASVDSYELPGRAEIEEDARRIYDAYRTNNAVEVKKASADVSRKLLAPAARHLGRRRLLIVASGALQYLPFGALHAVATAPSRPLIADCEIVILPSASTLAVLRRELSGRQQAAKSVAVLADPVFDRNDPRVNLVLSEKPSGESAGSPKSANASVTSLERSAREVGLLSFDRLRSTRREAEDIIASTRLGTGLKALDFEASRATAVSGELAQYRIVHFATHGMLNNQHPELSGLVLSLVDERGQPQDGFLRAHEVYNMKLGADLVVLSGCQTALGKEAKGEGLLGLTRGFMYAGSPRVVASLWQVPDRATAELMKRFYRGMLVEGLQPAAALRAAQVAMLKDKRWNAPYYWAAFVLQGEWR